MLGRQKFKKYSGILTMYFKFSVHRSAIFNGRAAMNNNKFDISMKRTKPIFTKNFRKIVVAIKGGRTKKYNPNKTMPVHSR